ncbi:MAG: hypothetical protein ACK56I_01575, partial [bacterium]
AQSVFTVFGDANSYHESRPFAALHRKSSNLVRRTVFLARASDDQGARDDVPLDIVETQPRLESDGLHDVAVPPERHEVGVQPDRRPDEPRLSHPVFSNPHDFRPGFISVPARPFAFVPRQIAVAVHPRLGVFLGVSPMAEPYVKRARSKLRDIR